MKRYFLPLVLFVLPPALWAATPLTLSDQQITLLKQYLPEDDSTSLVWKGDSLTIALPIGQETRLIFPEPIQADLNGSLSTDQLRIINNEDSLYLTAQKAFAKTRMYVTLKNSQRIILLDVMTNENATNATRKITLAEKSSNTATSSNDSQKNETASEAITSADSYVNAIRFAWQQLYSPGRLIPQNSNFVRAPMHTENWVSNLVYGAKVLAHPTASWVNNGLYITVVELRNPYDHSTSIHLKQDICGNWQGASLYPHSVLKPVGDKSNDSAVLFLISTQPFNEAIQVCYGGA